MFKYLRSIYMKGFMLHEGEGSGGSGDEKVEISASELAELKANAGKAETLSGELESSKKKIGAMEGDLMSDDYLAFLESKNKGGGGGGGTPPAKGDSLNWDDMSNSQMAQALEERIATTLDAFGKTIGKSLENFDTRTGKAFAEFDVKMAGVKYQDFGDALNTKEESRTPEQKELITKMKETATANPKWNAEQCLKEAKRQIKLSQEESAEKAAQKKKEDLALLAEKTGAPNSSIKAVDMDSEEAAEKAWELSMGDAASL